MMLASFDARPPPISTQVSLLVLVLDRQSLTFRSGRRVAEIYLQFTGPILAVLAFRRRLATSTNRGDCERRTT